jgi:hypothetical protein
VTLFAFLGVNMFITGLHFYGTLKQRRAYALAAVFG